MRHHHGIWAVLLLGILAACSAGNPVPSPTAASSPIALVTVYTSPTPNADEAAATRAASSPTPLVPTATVIPSETPYVGIFIGEVEPEEGFAVINEPLLAGAAQDAAPTSNPDVCVIPIDAPYLATWRTVPAVSQRMGCPIQEGFGFFGAVQVFERGVIYHYPEIDALWAIVPTRVPGSASAQGRYEYLENPPERSTTGIDVEPPLLLPESVFADMWLGVPDLQGQMGFAQTPAQEAALGLQRFENGTFFLDATSEQVYALVVDGTMLGPFLAPQDAEPGVRPALELDERAESTQESAPTPQDPQEPSN